MARASENKLGPCNEQAGEHRRGEQIRQTVLGYLTRVRSNIGTQIHKNWVSFSLCLFGSKQGQWPVDRGYNEGMIVKEERDKSEQKKYVRF